MLLAFYQNQLQVLNDDSEQPNTELSQLVTLKFKNKQILHFGSHSTFQHLKPKQPVSILYFYFHAAAPIWLPLPFQSHKKKRLKGNNSSSSLITHTLILFRNANQTGRQRGISASIWKMAEVKQKMIEEMELMQSSFVLVRKRQVTWGAGERAVERDPV